MSRRIIEILKSSLNFIGFGLISQRQRILIVEDDRSVEPFLQRLISKISPNCQIDWVETGAQALAMLHHKRYDLVVADVFLEGTLTGADLRGHCAKHYPTMPFIVMSGFSEDLVRSQFNMGSYQSHYLGKPLAITQCRDALRSALSKIEPL